MLSRFRGKNVKGAITALKQSQCVFFDVDSTVIAQEGLDEFACFLSKYDVISAITNKSGLEHPFYD